MTTNKCPLCHGAVRYREAERVREPIEMQDRTQTTIRLPCALMEQLRREADERGKTFNSLVVNVLWKFVKRGEDG